MMTTAIRLFALSLILVSQLSGLAGLCRGQSAQGLADGAGVWMNIWNYPDGDMNTYCSTLERHGIRNLFVQTSRSNTEAVAHPEKLGPLIDACHQHHIHLIAWSFAELANPRADADKLITAARFVSPSGDRIDAIAGDMENSLDNARVEQYSQSLRANLGQNYPMIAVVYSPLNHATQATNTPWKLLSTYWDVLAPMTYWAGKKQTLDAYTYTTSTIREIRLRSGRSDIEIHPIGDGMHASLPAIQAFLKACKDSEAASASLYPNQKVTLPQLELLSRYSDYFQPNARFRLAAYRELRKSGYLPEPPQGDPSQYIMRGEFYRLLVKQAYAGNVREGDARQAMQILTDLGLINPDPEQSSPSYLNAPLSSTEAYALVANMMEAASHNYTQAKTTSKSHHRADSWFVQPAHAEAHQAAPGESHLFNYLDAAQLILQSEAGWRPATSHS